MGLLPIAFVNVFTERWSSATCIVRMALYEAEMALSDWSKSFEQYVGENVARQGLILLFSSERILLVQYLPSANQTDSCLQRCRNQTSRMFGGPGFKERGVTRLQKVAHSKERNNFLLFFVHVLLDSEQASKIVFS